MADYTFPLESGSFNVFGGDVTLWLSRSFAASWFADAKKEAEAALQNRDSRRREIVFAVCSAESYLLEWVRDDIFKGKKLQRLTHYFPVDGRHLGIVERWKEVLRHLYERLDSWHT